MIRRAIIALLASLVVAGAAAPGPALAQGSGPGIEELWKRFPLDDGAPPAPTTTPERAPAAPSGGGQATQPRAEAPRESGADGSKTAVIAWLVVALLAALLVVGLVRRKPLPPRSAGRPPLRGGSAPLRGGPARVGVGAPRAGRIARPARGPAGSRAQATAGRRRSSRLRRWRGWRW